MGNIDYLCGNIEVDRRSNDQDPRWCEGRNL